MAGEQPGRHLVLDPLGLARQPHGSRRARVATIGANLEAAFAAGEVPAAWMHLRRQRLCPLCSSPINGSSKGTYDVRLLESRLFHARCFGRQRALHEHRMRAWELEGREKDIVMEH